MNRKEGFSLEEAMQLFSQESEPPTAVDRLNSMIAILNTLRRNGFLKVQQQEANKQLSFLAQGILDAPPENRGEVDSIINSYRKDQHREVRELGKRLRKEINAARFKI